MNGERYVLVGLARSQSRWFLDVARWSTSGALPAEFVKAVTSGELRARLQSGRRFSALLIDASLPACDRDLIELATASDCAVLVADDRPGTTSWAHLGVAAVLPPDFGREELLTVLRSVAQPVARADAVARSAAPHDPAEPRWRGRIVAVTGAAGTGRSTVALALATGWARDPRHHGLVVLADLALRAQQGLLHDAGDVVPGLSELVGACRVASLAPIDVRRMCFEVPRGYDLLLGLRRQRDWAALRGRAVVAALDGLRSAYRLVVTDSDADVEGDAECGSTEVEERNVLARTSLRAADLVIVVGRSGVAGVHAQVLVLRDLLDLGVPAGRLLPVINRAPRHPRARAELGRGLVTLLDAVTPGVVLAAGPLFVGERRRLDDVVRDEGGVPSGFVTGIADPVWAVLEHLTSEAVESSDRSVSPELVAVAPGSLPNWSPFSEEAV
ncbi:MAG TPA: hypothetical protein VGJ86_25715 [Acidimicrobiales bacterium]|jgi:hypothetical protein